MPGKLTLEELLAAVCSADANVRAAGWPRAGEVGTPALRPLADLVGRGELEVGRTAKRALWTITRTVGAPGASGKPETIAALALLLDDTQPVDVRREVLWMLSEIAGSEAVRPIAALLTHPDLQEDCRMVLERIPGEAAVDALRAALDAAPESFKYHLADSLRARGVEVPGYPSQKLVPQRETRVQGL
jgi:HEAT repeat protein